MSGRKSTVLRAVSTVILFALSVVVIAEEPEVEFKNNVELFLGNTQAGSSNGATVGLSYERRLTRLFGVGGFIEYAGGDFENSALGINAMFHPHAGWVFKLSPGAEIESGEWSALFRVGVAYDFEIAPQWLLSPEVNVKLIEGEKEVVYGLTLGYDF